MAVAAPKTKLVDMLSLKLTVCRYNLKDNDIKDKQQYPICYKQKSVYGGTFDDYIFHLD